MNNQGLDSFLNDIDKKRDRSRSNSRNVSTNSVRPILKNSNTVNRNIQNMSSSNVQDNPPNPLNETVVIGEDDLNDGQHQLNSMTELDNELRDLRRDSAKQGIPNPNVSVNSSTRNAQVHFDEENPQSSEVLNQERTTDESKEALIKENEKLRQELIEALKYNNLLKSELENVKMNTIKMTEKEKKYEDLTREYKFTHKEMKSAQSSVEKENAILKERLMNLELQMGEKELNLRNTEESYHDVKENLWRQRLQQRESLQRFGQDLNEIEGMGSELQKNVNKLNNMISNRFEAQIANCGCLEEFIKDHCKQVIDHVSGVVKLMGSANVQQYLSTVNKANTETSKHLELNEKVYNRYVELSRENENLQARIDSKKSVLSEFTYKATTISVQVAAFQILIGVIFTYNFAINYESKLRK